MKIAINKCYGGFGLSQAVFEKLGIEYDGYGYLSNEDFGIEDNNYYKFRSNKKLISAIEEIGVDKASSSMADIEIVDIPDDIEWEISDYDGIETIHEAHRSW